MKLSPNFSLEELTYTSTGLANEPDASAKTKLLYLANYLLQPVRDRWGALTISSGFRNMVVNSVIGGASTSQHLFGEAADFIPYAVTYTYPAKCDEVFEWLVKESGLTFGQAILEKKVKNGEIKRWIHLSLVRMNGDNNQALIFKDGKYDTYKS